jgi:hypothetical protein
VVGTVFNVASQKKCGGDKSGKHGDHSPFQCFEMIQSQKYSDSLRSHLGCRTRCAVMLEPALAVSSSVRYLTNSWTMSM